MERTANATVADFSFTEEKSIFDYFFLFFFLFF